MGNGCLRPQPRSGQIYIDCINQIYTEIQNMNTQNSITIYADIKQKISKKGSLRKLMDYLTSHRSSISEAALHNYRLMVQTKGTQCKIAGLVVIDFIVNSVLKQSNLNQNQQIKNLHQLQINAESMYQQSEQKQKISNLRLSNQMRSHKNIQASQKHIIQVSNVSGLQKSYVKSNFSLMLRQIYNPKFNSIFFNMIQTLLYEQIIYEQVLKSIIKYCSFDSTKNCQQQKIVQIVNILLEHINSNDQLTLSLKAYYLLIPKLKGNSMDTLADNLKVFITIWEQTMTFKNNGKSGFSYNADQLPTNQILIQSIIKQIISRMIGSSSINKIYEQIINVYDSRMFQNMIHFEEMLISIMQKQDLKDQFLRGLYSFLLAYLAVCKSVKNPSIKVSMMQNPLMVVKWSNLNVSKPYQSFLLTFTNISQIKSKRECINTLKRWIQCFQFVQIDKLIKYNSSLFLNSFLFNICNYVQTDREFAKFFANMLAEFVAKAELKQKIAVANSLFYQIKNQIQNDMYKIFVASLINQFLSEQFIQTQKNSIIQFALIDQQHSIDVNSKLLIESTTIVSKFTQRMLGYQIDQLAYFLNSIFEFLSYSCIQDQKLIIFNSQSIFLIKTIQKMGGSLLLLAFCQRMVKAINSEMDKKNFFYCWDLILNCSYLLIQSSRNQKRQKNRKQLNQIYITIMQINNIKSSINKIKMQQYDQKVQQLIYSKFGQLTQQEQQANILRLTLPSPHDFQPILSTQSSSFLIINQKMYQLSSIVFRDIFSRGISIVKGGFLHKEESIEHVNYTQNQFGRSTSIIREEDLNQEQRSINDVVDMIHV